MQVKVGRAKRKAPAGKSVGALAVKFSANHTSFRILFSTFAKDFIPRYVLWKMIIGK